MEIYKETTEDASKDSNFACAKYKLGHCHVVKEEWQEAKVKLEEALEIYQKKTSDTMNDRDIAETSLVIGRCCLELKQYEEALESLKAANERYGNSQIDYDVDFGFTQYWMGCCKKAAKNPREAIEHFRKALKHAEQRSLDCEEDSYSASIKTAINHCKLINHSKL